MERMINDRLASCFFNPLYSSRKPRLASTKQEAQWITLCTFVREGFLNGEHVVSIFFSNLDKAYDTTLKYGIMKDLQIFTSEDVYPFLFKDFYLKGNS